MYVRSKPGSLWDTITTQCSSIELSEVKGLIGESLVEQISELHIEATSLREILGENDDPAISDRARIHSITQSITKLAKHMKSNQPTSEVTEEIRKALHMETTRLRSEIKLLQEQLDQGAGNPDTPPTSRTDEHSPSNSRLNSAKRFRQMVTNIRNCDDHDS